MIHTLTLQRRKTILFDAVIEMRNGKKRTFKGVLDLGLSVSAVMIVEDKKTITWIPIDLVTSVQSNKLEEE